MAIADDFSAAVDGDIRYTGTGTLGENDGSYQ